MGQWDILSSLMHKKQGARSFTGEDEGGDEFEFEVAVEMLWRR